MDEESVMYEPSEFLKTKKDFLKDYSFKFEGLSDECERGFIHIVKDLGGKVSKNAKYTLVEKSYLEKDENKHRKDLYHLYFILDCIDHRKVLDIELYRCAKTCNKNKENSPSILQNKSRNDNKSNKDNIGNFAIRNNFSNESHSEDDVPISKRISESKAQDNNQTLKTHISKVNKRKPDIRSDSSNISTDVSNNFSNESNSEDDSPISEKIKKSKSQDNDKTVKKNNSKAKKRRCNAIRSDTDSSSSDKPVKIKPEPKSSESSEDDSYLTSNTLNKSKKVNVKIEASSNSDDSTNIESDSEPSMRKRRKKESDLETQINSEKTISQKKKNSKATKRTWVDTKFAENKKNKNNIKDNKNNVEKTSSSNSAVEWTKLKAEEREDLKWLFEVDKNNLCDIKKCTFEPGPHESHSYPGRIISDEEKKVILKYLIKNNWINRAKGIRTWEIMINEGYLTHRSAESLRNCLRRILLPGICRFKLPLDITDQFLSLDEKKAKGKKIW